MSKDNQTTVKCPKCGHEASFRIWESINTDINPELKEKVRSGEILKFLCPECKAESMVEYPCLYHQMSDKYMVYYAPGVVDEAVKGLNDMLQSTMDIPVLNSKEDGYKFRVVENRQEFNEKLAILDDGYDDRIMELVKLSLYAILMEQNPNLEINRIYYIHEKAEPEFVVVLTDDTAATTPFILSLIHI